MTDTGVVNRSRNTLLSVADRQGPRTPDDRTAFSLRGHDVATRKAARSIEIGTGKIFAHLPCTARQNRFGDTSISTFPSVSSSFEMATKVFGPYE